MRRPTNYNYTVFNTYFYTKLLNDQSSCPRYEFKNVNQFTCHLHHGYLLDKQSCLQLTSLPVYIIIPIHRPGHWILAIMSPSPWEKILLNWQLPAPVPRCDPKSGKMVPGWVWSIERGLWYPTVGNHHRWRPSSFDSEANWWIQLWRFCGHDHFFIGSPNGAFLPPWIGTNPAFRGYANSWFILCKKPTMTMQKLPGYLEIK